MIEKVKQFIKVRTRDMQYAIGYRKMNRSSCLYHGNYKSEFVTIRPTLRYWYADPIINEIYGEEYLFCEMFDQISQKGAIGISYRDRKGRWSRPKKIIGGKKTDQHLSFPVIVCWKDEYYMFPCIGNGFMLVYKMGNSEREWTLWSELFDERYYVDAIFKNRDGRLYMISSILDKEDGHSTKLSINEIFDLEIQEQMQIGPAVIEGTIYETATRNGGKLLNVKVGEKLEDIRVTQESDKVNGYGNNLQFRSISVKNGILDEKLYYRVVKEHLKTDLDKSIWFEKIGPHTYSQSKNEEIIDIKIYAFSIIYIIRYIVANIKELFDNV